LAEELVKQDGIRIDEARDVVKEAFKSYLHAGFRRSVSWQAAENDRSGFSRSVKKALKELEKNCKFLNVLGSYPAGR